MAGRLRLMNPLRHLSLEVRDVNVREAPSLHWNENLGDGIMK